MTDADIKARQKSNNTLLGGILIGFVLLVFLITIVKMMNGHSMEAFDHGVRSSLEEGVK